MATKRQQADPTPPSPAATSFFDVGGLMTMHSRNIEIMVEANRIFIDAAQAVARCQADMMRDYVEQMARAFAELSGRGEPSDVASKEGAAVQALFEKTGDHVRDIAELVNRSNAEVVQLVNGHLRSVVDEVAARSSREKVAAE